MTTRKSVVCQSIKKFEFTCQSNRGILDCVFIAKSARRYEAKCFIHTLQVDDRRLWLFISFLCDFSLFSIFVDLRLHYNSRCLKENDRSFFFFHLYSTRWCSSTFSSVKTENNERSKYTYIEEEKQYYIKESKENMSCFSISWWQKMRKRNIHLLMSRRMLNTRPIIIEYIDLM